VLQVVTYIAAFQFFLVAVLGQTNGYCMLNPKSLVYPNTTCQSVFRLPGATSRLHYVSDGDHAWVAAKFAFSATQQPMEYQGEHVLDNLPSSNYHVSQILLMAIAEVSSDILMAEAESFVYANMASALKFQTVRNNILNDCAWFSNTHGSSSLQEWMMPMAPGFNIPDPQQSSGSLCVSSFCGSGGHNFVFDSCENEFGSNLQLNSLFRMRCAGYDTGCSSLNSAHSIWFRIPMTYRSICDDAVAELHSVIPFSVPMLSFSAVTVHGDSFSVSSKYFCVFLPLPLAQPITLIHASFVSSTQLICNIVADFVPPDQFLPISIEQELCSGGTCSRCPIRTSEFSESTGLGISFLPVLLKPASAIGALGTGGSSVSIAVAGGFFDQMRNRLLFPEASILLVDASGVNVSLTSVYVPGTWPMGSLEFVLPEWPNESRSVRLSVILSNETETHEVYSADNITISFISGWKNAFPLEVSDTSRQINIKGWGFVRLHSYSCVFSPLFDGASKFVSSTTVGADYVSFTMLRCSFSATAGRYRLNVYENGIQLPKSGAYTDIIAVDNVASVAPSQLFASAANFSVTVFGSGFDADPLITSYQCVVLGAGSEIVTSNSAVVVELSDSSSLTPMVNRNAVLCSFSAWIYSSGTYEMQLINKRFSRVLSGSILKVSILPVWTAIMPSTASNLISSLVTLYGYGLPRSLHVEAIFRSSQNVRYSTKAAPVIPRSPFLAVFQTPSWPFENLIASVELSVASSSTSIVFSGYSRVFAFEKVPPTLVFTPSVFDCSLPITVVVQDTRRLSTNGSGYQCQFVGHATQVTVPAYYNTEISVQCSFGSWGLSTVPATLQLLYFGSIIAVSRSLPLCKPKLSSVSPNVILSGSRSQVTIIGAFIDASVAYSCIVGGDKSKASAAFLSPSNSAVVCTIDFPQTASVLNTFIALESMEAVSNPLPLVIQTMWKSLYPSVVCLNTRSLLTITGTFFSKDNRHELIFDYQTVAMTEYLKGLYVKPFPLPRSVVTSLGIEVIGSTQVTFNIPFNNLLNAVEIQVSLRINGSYVPVGSSPSSQQFSLPFFTSAAEFSPDQVNGVVSFYDADDLKICETPCRWNPRAGITGALVGSAQLLDGWVMSPDFTSEKYTNVASSESSTLIIGFKPPNLPVVEQFIVSHGSLPGNARIALWSSSSSSSQVRWTNDPSSGLSIPYNVSEGSSGYWVGSFHNFTVKHSLNTADHSVDSSSLFSPLSLSTVDSALIVGSCSGQFPGSDACKFKGGVKFIILYDRQLSSQEHLNIARWANLVHGVPSFSRSDASFVQPWGVYPGVERLSLSTCALPLFDSNYRAPACQLHPFRMNGRFPAGISCISADNRSFRLSLAGGLFARSVKNQVATWLSDPSSSFVCEVSSASGFRSFANGTIISVNYTNGNQFNFVNNVVLECNVTLPSSKLSTFENGLFRYAALKFLSKNF
jgi:hypothetical protein